eukprot:203502-Chlamydomonas_euryale.AAC.2
MQPERSNDGVRHQTFPSDLAIRPRHQTFPSDLAIKPRNQTLTRFEMHLEPAMLLARRMPAHANGGAGTDQGL